MSKHTRVVGQSFSYCKFPEAKGFQPSKLGFIEVTAINFVSRKSPKQLVKLSKTETVTPPVKYKSSNIATSLIQSPAPPGNFSFYPMSDQLLFVFSL